MADLGISEDDPVMSGHNQRIFVWGYDPNQGHEAWSCNINDVIKLEKFILQLEAQLMDKNVTFDLSIKASEWLASNGYDEKMGARPLSRLIQDSIKKPLAEDLLFGKLTKGGLVKVCIKNDAIHLDISSLEKPRLSSNKPPPLLTAK